jgi:hypothetical protein
MRRSALCLLALALGACAGGSRAYERDNRENEGRRAGLLLNPAGLMIAAADSDGDYRVTAAELSAAIMRGFAAADRDDSGGLTLIELADWRAAAFGSGEALPGRFAFDANQDSSVSEAEFAAAIRAASASYAGADGAIPFSALLRTNEMQRERESDDDRVRRMIREGQGY